MTKPMAGHADGHQPLTGRPGPAARPTFSLHGPAMPAPAAPPAHVRAIKPLAGTRRDTVGLEATARLRVVARPPPPLRNGAEGRASAIVFCDGHFGGIDGKTANGLVRHSEKYQILSVIDSQKAGCDAGVVLGDEPNGIPIWRDLAAALEHAGGVPDYFIIGIAPASGMLSASERALVLHAMALGMNIVNGLHEFLTDDPEFLALSIAKGVTLCDVRKPSAKKDLHVFTGRLSEVTCPRIAVLGTDCAIAPRPPS